MNRILAFAFFCLLLGACRREERPPLPTPTIFQIDQLLLRAGDTITITGEAFSPTAAANQVLFNGIAGRPVSGNLRTIRVIVPDGAGSGTLQVIRDGRASNRFPYEYEGRLEIGEEVLLEAAIPEGFGIADFFYKSNGELFVAFLKVDFQFSPTFLFTANAQVKRYNLRSSNTTNTLTTDFTSTSFINRPFSAMHIADNYQIFNYNNRYFARTQSTGGLTQLSGIEFSSEQLFADSRGDVYATILNDNTTVFVVRFPNGTLSGYSPNNNIVAAVPFPLFSISRVFSTIDEEDNIYIYTSDGSIHKSNTAGADVELLTSSLPADLNVSTMLYLKSRKSLVLFNDNGEVALFDVQTKTLSRLAIRTFIPELNNFELLSLVVDEEDNLLVLAADKSGSNIFQIRPLRIR